MEYLGGGSALDLVSIMLPVLLFGVAQSYRGHLVLV